jgi:hypothetical protein
VPSYCAVHEKDEPTTDETYRVCFECGHVYETEKDLEEAWDETYPQTLLRGRPARKIDFCPICLHDF